MLTESSRPTALRASLSEGNRRAQWAECTATLAALMVLLPVLVVTWATISFAYGGSVHGWHLVFAGLAVGGLAFRLSPTRKSAGWMLLAMAITLAGSLAVATAVADLSFDGLYYHQGAVMEFVQGWNPWQGGVSGRFHTLTLWADYYPKAAWINGAVMVALTDQLDTGKWLQVWLGVAAVAATFSLILRFTAVRIWFAGLAAVGVAANPVLLYQMTTFYVDGILGCLFLILSAGLIRLIFDDGKRGWWLVGPTILLIINIKQTGVVFTAMLGAAAVATAWARARSDRFKTALRVGVPLLLLGLVGGLFLGFSPYGNNLWEGRHVFYPLLGADKYDMVGPRRPPNLPANRGGAFLAAQFAQSDFPRHEAEPIRPKLPWVIRADEIKSGLWFSPDIKSGGFGPLFGAGVVLSVGGMLALLISGQRRRFRLAAISSAVLAATILCHDLCWWARYVPQAWLLVWIGPLATLDLPGRGWFAWRWVGVTLALINCLIVGGASWRGHQDQMIEWRATQEAVRTETFFELHPGSFPVLAARFREAGITNFKIVSAQAAPGVERHVLFSASKDAYWTKGSPAPRAAQP